MDATVKKILVTGGTGFLGNALNKILLSNDYAVVMYTSKKSRLDRVSNYKSKVEILFREEFSPEEVLCNSGIQTIVHNATCFGRSGESDFEVFQTNLDYSIQLFEGGIKNGIRWFFNSDTSLPKNINAYSLSKSKFKEYVRNRVYAIDLNVINVTLESIYGPGDDSTKFITWFMNQCKRNVSKIDLTGGDQKRDFIYIDDAALAYFMILHSKDKFKSRYENINIGSGQSHSIREICELIKKITLSTSHLNFGKFPYRDNEIMLSVADIRRLKDFGFQLETKLENGLRKMMEFDFI
jgi:nucleoside-diphosphate-sugar epimerase